MKKLLAIAILLAGTMVMVSCDEDGDTITEFTNIKGLEVSSNITSDVTWEAGSQVTLTDRIAVESGATLTIEAGVVVYGLAGTGANATALIIAQGATLNANGTASAPIIMTSIADDIEPGDIASPNLADDVDGLWGGLIVLGNASISIEGDGSSTNIEGIPASDSNGLYGGSNDADNSGSITYVSVRHGGTNIGEGNEINGITFGGVGTGTTVNHLEVVATQDDGYEFFGGTVNASDLIVWNNGDDALDTDQAYAGTIDNFIIINPGDKGFELDGPEGAYNAAHTITNGHVYLGGSGGGYDDDSDDFNYISISNVYFTGITEDTGSSNDFNHTASNLQLDNTYNDDDDNAVDVAVADFFGEMTGNDGSGDPIFTLVAPGANTVGATASEFTGWSFAAARGAGPF